MHACRSFNTFSLPVDKREQDPTMKKQPQDVAAGEQKGTCSRAPSSQHCSHV
jgi:hypothetical protein